MLKQFCTLTPAFLLPSKSVEFVGTSLLTLTSLLSTEDEEQLEFAVTKVFREYGVVFVKIRRDRQNMPFAFCQYMVSNFLPIDPLNFEMVTYISCRSLNMLCELWQRARDE